MEKLQNIVSQYGMSYYNSENQLVFDPSACTQRYSAALNCLTHEKFKNKINRIIEFGCSAMQFFVHIKNGCQNQNIYISLVDIDENVLSNNLNQIQPLISEHIKKRHHELKVDIWKGNIAKPNNNFKNVDCVIALELIEHLYPDVLEEVPYHVFEAIAPKIAIISTPNSDFNRLFPFDEGRVFRHDDHKFEWNREQFKAWCDNICLRFPDYFVQIEGIGPPPKNKLDEIDQLGHCSQLALFIRKDFIESLESDDDDDESKKTNKIMDTNENENIEIKLSEDYKLMASVDYPVFIDSRDQKQKIFDEASYHINRFKYTGDFYNDIKNRIEIPIDSIAASCWEITDSKNEVLVAIKDKYLIENDMVIIEYYDSEEMSDDEKENETNSDESFN